MTRHPTRLGPAGLATAVAVVAATDLGSKLWASRALHDRDIELPGPVDLALSHNDGVAFGVLRDAPTALVLLLTAAVTAAVIAAGVKGALPRWPCALVAGGALGNLIDRLEAGSVVDMLHTGWWPTFNLADVFITTGVALLLLNASCPQPPSPTSTSQLAPGPTATHR